MKSPWVALLLLGLTGCVDDGARIPGSARVDTLDGIVQVTNTGPGIWTDDSAWSVQEEFRIGGSHPPPSHLFTSGVLAPAVGPDGNIHVLEHLTATIAVFSPAGEPLHNVGTRGRGPSELAMPTGWTWDDRGNIWVADPGNRKYAVFDPSGEFLASHPRPYTAAPRRIQAMAWIPGMGIVDEASESGKVVILRLDPDGSGPPEVLMRLPIAGGASQAVMDATIRRPGEEFTLVGRHYVPRMKWAIDPGTSTLWVGMTDEARFIQLNLRGDTLRVVTAPHLDGEGLTAADEAMITVAMRQSGLSRAQIDPIRPVFQAMHVVDGHLWVQLVDTPGVPSPRFGIFDSEGIFLGTLDLGFPPDPLGNLYLSGNHLVAPMLGDFDVPFVVVARLSSQ